MKYISVFLTTIYTSHSLCQDTIRPELIQAGSLLANANISAEDFVAEGIRLRNQTAFSEDEIAYLGDLRQKIPPEIEEKVCSSKEPRLCERQKTDLLQKSLTEESSKLIEPMLDPSPKQETPDHQSQWSKESLLILGLAVTLIGGSLYFKNKEIQVSTH